MTQNVTTVLDRLNLMDRFLFDETMEFPEAYQATVGILLEQELEFLDRVQTEKELRVSPELRAIRLDVIGMDSDRNIYYTEMQKNNTKNLIRRSRYYQAQADVSLLEPGCVDFNRLNDSCFILVAPFDIFGKGLYRYTFEGVCRECPELKLNDGAMRVFINTKGKNRKDFSREFLDFMDYITASTNEVAEKSDSDRIRLIHETVCKIRRSEKAGVRYMQAWEEKIYDREESRAAGLAEGRAQGIEALILDNREEGKTEEQIVAKLVRLFDMTKEQAKEYYDIYAAQ